MELLAICVVLVGCVILVAMVIGMAVTDLRRQRDRKVVDIDSRLAPYDRVVDLRDTGAERYLQDRLKDSEYAGAYHASRFTDG